jgi:peroxidase
MGLTSLQVLFLREHNRLCDQLVKENKSLSDEEIYNMARNYVIGLIQKISMYEYLPNLFGPMIFNIMVGEYKGYNSSVDPTLMNEFSSTAYRIGHPYIPKTYKAVNNEGVTV